MDSQIVNHVTVEGEREGQRLDNFLVSLLRGVPKSHVYRIIRRGEVRVNKKRAKPAQRLNVDDVIRIPPLRISEPKTQAKAPKWQSIIQNSIIFEDDDIIIVNKPAGLAVHGGSGIHAGLIEQLRLMRQHADNYELVHRLDRETSGCLLVAKKRSMLRALHEALREHTVHKQYVALLEGIWQGNEVTIDAPLLKNHLRSGERIVKVSRFGKPAETTFRKQRVLGDSTLVDVTLHTGRTHQIRVHAQHMGHPVAGDEKYGSEQSSSHGLMLHAETLVFAHPRDGRTMTIKAPWPPRFRRHVE